MKVLTGQAAIMKYIESNENAGEKVGTVLLMIRRTISRADLHRKSLKSARATALSTNWSFY
jgi:non-canonical (house-cleaning) NTP pyrophosphatase